MKKWAVAIMVACLSPLLSCSLLGPNVPSELSGTWSRTSSDGYVEEFTFRSSTIQYKGYSEDWPGEFDASYDAKIVEIFQGEDMLRTEDDMYFAWHVDGETLYLYKTNPYSEKLVLDATWWTSGEGYRTLYKS